MPTIPLLSSCMLSISPHYLHLTIYCALILSSLCPPIYHSFILLYHVHLILFRLAESIESRCISQPVSPDAATHSALLFIITQDMLQSVYTRMQIRIHLNWFDFTRSVNANQIKLIRFQWYHLGLWYSNQIELSWIELVVM